MNFKFTQYGNADHILDFMLGDRLYIPKTDYPDYNDWLAKVHTQLKNMSKQAIVCFSSNQLVGSILFQQHQTTPTLLELKNLTISPTVRDRFIASFLVKNAEIEGKNIFHSVGSICDAKEANTAIRGFLLRLGYKILANLDLYKLHSGNDTIYFKEFYGKTNQHRTTTRTQASLIR